MTTHSTPSTGRIALVTGANRGIGRATALRLAEHGTDVVITYRSHAGEAAETVGAATALGRTARALQLDAGRVAGFGAFADALRGVLKEGWDRDTFDFLVNNAGTALYAPFAETSAEDFDRLLDVHFRGVFFLTQTLLPLLADGGRVINVSTGLTRFGSPGSSAYAAMKGAVEVLTRYLALELGPRGIRANTVAPGPVATDFGGGRLRGDEAMRSALAAHTALGRVGESGDIAGVVATLLAEDTGWLTGQRVEASGGILL
ncbi:SDR family NAD(P)-dependent oxidoreductase [Streptomyces sp. NPDC049879]|uniref:SDR family NAD(P)-dependent oxidoreductase n=1 Tax=Streptomyces sp. NPDC049879 TaxID=3365598 RepID=UPI0037AE0C6C